MLKTSSFQEAIETVEKLSLDEQEMLINILKNRLREQKRVQLVKDIKDAEQEFSQGKCQPVTPDEIMEEILS